MNVQLKDDTQTLDEVVVVAYGTAFNSLVQLEVEKGIPRNPFINAGAIVMTDILLNHLKHPEEEYLRFVRSISGNNQIHYNEEVALSERENGYLNAAITRYWNIRTLLLKRSFSSVSVSFPVVLKK